MLDSLAMQLLGPQKSTLQPNQPGRGQQRWIGRVAVFAVLLSALLSTSGCGESSGGGEVDRQEIETVLARVSAETGASLRVAGHVDSRRLRGAQRDGSDPAQNRRTEVHGPGLRTGIQGSDGGGRFGVELLQCVRDHPRGLGRAFVHPRHSLAGEREPRTAQPGQVPGQAQRGPLGGPLPRARPDFRPVTIPL